MERSRENLQFTFTALGAAMGLGNAMRFPGLCYLYGGAFIIAYAAVLAAFGFPLLCAELSLGKRYREPFPAAFAHTDRRAAGIGWAACLNSALIAVYYSAVIVRLAQNGVSFYAFVDSGFTPSPSLISAILAVLCWLALAICLTASARARSRLARTAVLTQVALMALLAARGLIYNNSGAALAALFGVRAEVFGNPEMWLNCLGQALLSLSVAAGVMPSFAVNMPRQSSPKVCAAKVSVANFAGGLLAAVSLLTVAYGCNLTESITADGLANAFALYPAALAITFKNGVISGIFGTLFFLSLSLTAFVSALSLFTPLYDALSRRFKSKRRAAYALCGVAAALSLPFLFIRSWTTYADFFACNVVAPVVAAAEIFVFSAQILTNRARRGKIYVWKSSYKSMKN